MMSATMRFCVVFAILLIPSTGRAQPTEDANQTVLSERRVIQPEDEPTSFAGSVATLGNVSDLAVSPDGRLAVAGHGRAGGPGALSVWNLESLTPVASFQELRQVTGISFSPDGKFVAYGTWQNQVLVRRLDTLQVVQQIRGFDFKPVKTTFSADSKRLFAAQNEITTYDTSTWKKVELKLEAVPSVSKPTWTYLGIDVSPDNSRLVAAGINRTDDFYGRAIVWDMKTGKVVCTKPHNQFIVEACFSPDGKRFATGDNQMQICDTETGETVQTCPFPANPVYDIAWSPSGQQLVVAGATRGYAVFEAATGQRGQLFVQPTNSMHRFNACRFTPDAKRIVTGASDAKVRVWDAKTHELLAELPSSVQANTSDQPVLAVAASSDGKWIAAAREDTTVTIHGATDGELIRTLEGHDDVVATVAFGANGTLASGGYDEFIKLWDVKTGKEIRTLEGHENWVFGVAFSPDGKTLASCSYDKTIRLWDVSKGEERLKIEGHTAAVRSVTYSPDGKRLASASSDRSIKIWDTTTGKQLLELKGHQGTVRSIAFSPDGRSVVSASEDKTARLWNVATGKETRVLSGQEGMVWSAAFSGGGSNVATVGFDRTVRIWNPADGQLRQTLQGHRDIVSSVTFAADAQAVITGSLDASIRIWRGTGR